MDYKSDFWINASFQTVKKVSLVKAAEIFNKVLNVNFQEDKSRPFDEVSSFYSKVLGFNLQLVPVADEYFDLNQEEFITFYLHRSRDSILAENHKALNITKFLLSFASSKTDLLEKLKSDTRLKASLHVTQKFSLTETIEKLDNLLCLKFEKDLIGTNAFASYQAKALGLNIRLLEAKDSYELSIFPDSDVSYEDVTDDVDFSSYLMSFLSVKSDLELK
jgi:hypothetical protein